jgi:hypothetical protein
MRKLLLVGGGVLIGLSVGLSGGYLLAKKRLQDAYDEALGDEIEATKRHYAIMHKDEGYETPEVALETLGILASERSASRDVMGTIIMGERYGIAGTAAKIVNVFEGVDEEDPDEDYSEEDAKRSKDVPYVISKEEFFENSDNRDQATMTYFAEDDVLADEADMPIDDVDAVVGTSNLDLFGHRSHDPRVVYVRNEKLRIEYEICKSDGSFAKEVGGFIEHSDRPKIRKFRRE